MANTGSASVDIDPGAHTAAVTITFTDLGTKEGFNHLSSAVHALTRSGVAVSFADGQRPVDDWSNMTEIHRALWDEYLR